jgi:hypothetical protein
MASTDARPVPRKNTAYRVTFPILDADGDLVTGATALDSEVSIDGGTFADATSEATEIATASGVYFLDLTAAEMNGDCIAVIVKTSTAGAKTTVLVFYPEEAGDYRVDVVQWLGTAAATPTVAGVPEVDVTHWRGTAAPAEHTSGYPVVTVKDGTGTGEIDTTSGGVLVSTLATQAKADVNAEVVDALATDTYAEPGQATPAATLSLSAKIGYLFKAWRNKSDQTATTYQLYNDDATTVDQKATVSDDATTFVRGEVATGP